MVKGTHIVVDRLYDHDRCYIFQNADGRICFAIPYEQNFTLIGTTDKDYSGDLAEPAISVAETDYLCSAASEYFAEPVRREDIVWTYSAVRPLYDDGASKAQEATRDYVIKADGGGGRPTLVNCFGGKITTYRRLAESVLEKIEEALGPKKPAWTAVAPLPGGNFGVTQFDSEVARLAAAYPFLGPKFARRLVRHYGMLAAKIVGDARSLADLGQHFGADLYAAEVRYLAARGSTIDQGTTSFSARHRAFDIDGCGCCDMKRWAGSIRGQKEFGTSSIYPASGWVEHDPEEIWSTLSPPARRR
jgi:glycerol-3-phosphate dehydrogenase